MAYKVYETPSIMTVDLQTQALLAESQVSDCNGGTLAYGGGGGGCTSNNPRTKEEKTQDVDVWNEEW